MDRPHPYITAALLCENVIEEKNGQLTIVRVADSVEWEMRGDLPKDYKPVVQLKGVIALKSGPMKGDYTVQVRVVRPNGEVKKDAMSVPFKFSGGDQGQNAILNIFLTIEEDGLHWFDVYFEGDVLTRIPIMISRKQPQKTEEQSRS